MPKPLSAAIRDGARLRPQAFASFFSFNSEGYLCSCSWGAAIEAVSPLITHVPMTAFGLAVFEELALIVQAWNFAEAFTTPACCLLGSHEDCSQVDTIAGLVSHLNDIHHWPREEIADRVAVYERQRAAEPTPA